MAPAIDPLDNEREVRAIARDHLHPGLDFDDLVQAGMVGVIRAAKAFDADGPAQFSSYARKAILGEIANAIREEARLIRVPANTLALARQGKEGERFDAARRVLGSRFVGETAFDDQGGLAELVEDHRAGTWDEGSVETMMPLIDELPPRESEIVKGLYGTGDGPELSAEQLGKALGLTPESVREIAKNALAVVRHRMENLERPAPRPNDEPTTMKSKPPHVNGHIPASLNGRNPAKEKCPSCGRAFKHKGRPKCYYRDCDQYHATPRSRKTDVASPPGAWTVMAMPTPVDHHALATLELQAMGGIVSLLAALSPAARGRVVTWVHDAYRPAGCPAGLGPLRLPT